MKRMLLCYTLTTLSLLITVSNLHAQTHFKSDIEKALAEKRIDDADEILHRAFENYLKEKSTDSIVELIFYVGKVNQLKSGKEAGVKAVQNLLISIKTLTKNPGILRQAYINAGEYYGSAGMNQLGYNSNLEAKRFSLIDPSKTGSEIALTENNLSTYAQRLGNVNLTELHGRQSLKYILSDKNPDPETSYISFNGMGSIMWYASKTDSALYFFHKALDALSKTKRTPRNQFFRPAIVENNLSALYQLEGKTTLAVEAMKSTIENLRKYIASDEPAPKKATAITFQFEATDNLAGIYQELGNYNKAQNLFEYSYSQKQLNLEPDDPAIFISQILLGKLYFAQRNEDKALQFLNNGLKNISASDGDYLFWQADAYYTLALLYGKRKDIARATEYYHQADKLYNESFQGTFDNIYLDFLQNESLFYAENNHNQEALKKANAAYRYVVQHQGAGTLSAFLQLLNLAEISNITGNFRASLDYSLKGLEVVNKLAATSDNLLDSIRIELKKPTAILQKGKAEYALMKNKNAENLSLLLEDMNKALQILERQKNILTDPKDVSILTADNSSLLEFIKKLNYEFYRITNDQSYIDRLMGLQESGVYNRIRSRLDKNDSLAFSRVPLSVRDTERKLKQLINDALKGEGTHEEKMRRYFLAVDNWTAYLAGVKKTYPAYYKMRYATIFKSGESVEKHIPENTSVIRYFFVGKDLFVLVADGKQKHIVQLNTNQLSEEISGLIQYGMDESKTSASLYSLYQKLWKPITTYIKHKKIVIIPDGVLYSLNFEILTPDLINSFSELATKSLLASYTISYNYSLILVNQRHSPLQLKNSFVAFVPGFSDKIKKEYLADERDSSRMDRGYLALLPQPFSLALATRIQNLLGGKTFMNEQSTQTAFKRNAGQNKIIHIGTHAESNNEHPQFSRLIFAKNSDSSDLENSLYVDEIYGCNLTSDLAVLTACESGKPGYQDGEGMISLAHAFNYAGSESILTGLWKIDEQASAMLVEQFYKGLLKGLAKDDALRQAKLYYLAHTEGRMLAPQYWAGLVIMGDTSPIVLHQQNEILWLIIIGSILIISTGVYFSYKRKRNVKIRNQSK